MIQIKRLLQDDLCTEGKLFAFGEYIGDTLELPWKNNREDVSCIPTAINAYRLVKRKVGRFARAYKERWGHDGSLQIKPVNGRTVILMHTGIKLAHTLGCPLVGKKLDRALLHESRNTYSDFWDALEPHWEDYEDVGIPVQVWTDHDEETEVDWHERMSMRPEDL